MTELIWHPDKMRSPSGIGDSQSETKTLWKCLIFLDCSIWKQLERTLRIHLDAPLLVPHMPSKTCIVAGDTVPEHSRVFINAWAIQRDPEFWKDTLQFEPEILKRH